VDQVTSSKKRRPNEAFPETLRTWLGEQLEGSPDGLCSAREHIMRVYAEPMAVYIRGSSFRKLDDPDDLVRGFFADRLSRETYLNQWRESGRPLRFWLIVGLKHYLLEETRRRRRGNAGALYESDAAGTEPASDGAYFKAVAIGVVREAISQTGERCRKAGLDEHWMIFRRRYIGGECYAQIAAEAGITPGRAAVMARTAAARFRDTLRESVGWDGATPSEIEDEIRSLMEVTGG